MPIRICGAVVLVCFASSSWAQPAPPLIKENTTVKIAPHVWAIPDANVGLVPNVGIVVGSRATMVVDTGLGPRNGATVVRELNKISTNAELYVATTHYHPEHSLGGAAFPATAKFIRPTVQHQEMQEVGKTIQNTFANLSPLHKELLDGVEYPRADILFEREHRLDLGGVHVRLFTRGPLHTKGDTMIFVEEDRVLFSGDVVMNNAFLAASANSSIKTWLTTLDELDALKPAVVVPSHGGIGDAALIARDREYLTAVQVRVAQLKAEGKSVEDVAQAVAPEIQAKFPAWTSPARVATAARAAYAEAR
jgi:glyoxylase-like metal-dependent hydrolase (beta-lactamase superfamily II)